MQEPDLRQQLNTIFKDVFDDDSIQIFDAMTAQDVKEWDSLNHINLMVAVENHFAVKFSVKEVSKLANVGELLYLIRTKLSSHSSGEPPRQPRRRLET